MNRTRFTGLLLVATMGLALSGCGGRGDDDDKPKAKASAPKTGGPNAEPGVTLSPEGQVRIGLEVQPLTEATAEPEVVAFGQLEEDPEASFVVRAPFAGTLAAGSQRPWPGLGASLASGAVVGSIEPRLAPADRVNATTQLASARAERESSLSALSTARASYERARILNADAKNVSDRALEEAGARVAAEEARVRTATDTVQLLEAALAQNAPGAGTPVRAEHGGTVVELLARSGEAIEAGAPILRVSDFSRLLARLNLPVGEAIPPQATHARLFAVGFENHPLAAERVGVSVPPPAGSAPGGQSFVFRTVRTEFGLRPGLAVTARIAVPGEARGGVVVPSSAVVRALGQTFVYIQTDANRFTRKAVGLGTPVDSGYLVMAGVNAGDRIVSTGAQLLLSEELRLQLQSDDDNQG